MHSGHGGAVASFRHGRPRLGAGLAAKVGLDFGQRFAMRFGQHEQREEEAHNGDGRKEPLDGIGAAQKVGQGSMESTGFVIYTYIFRSKLADLPIALNGGKHEQIGHRVRQRMADAADIGREQFGRHRPRNGQQTQHRAAHVQQDAQHRHPGDVLLALLDPQRHESREEHAQRHAQRRHHDERTAAEAFQQPRV